MGRRSIVLIHEPGDLPILDKLVSFGLKERRNNEVLDALCSHGNARRFWLYVEAKTRKIKKGEKSEEKSKMDRTHSLLFAAGF
jgi:hypothetical protein